MPRLADYFEFNQLSLNRIDDADIEQTVALINPAYSYQQKAKGAPRTNPQHLRTRAAETDFYVIKEGQRIVGCVYTEDHGKSLHFGLLTVADNWRKSGLASAIMVAIENYARALNYDSLQLDYMSLAPWLKRYYERYGFAETGDIKPWGSIDLIRMRKVL